MSDFINRASEEFKIEYIKIYSYAILDIVNPSEELIKLAISKSVSLIRYLDKRLLSLKLKLLRK